MAKKKAKKRVKKKTTKKRVAKKKPVAKPACGCKPSKTQWITIGAITVLGVIFLGLIWGIVVGAASGGIVWWMNNKK